MYYIGYTRGTKICDGHGESVSEILDRHFSEGGYVLDGALGDETKWIKVSGTGPNAVYIRESEAGINL